METSLREEQYEEQRRVFEYIAASEIADQGAEVAGLKLGDVVMAPAHTPGAQRPNLHNARGPVARECPAALVPTVASCTASLRAKAVANLRSKVSLDPARETLRSWKEKRPAALHTGRFTPEEDAALLARLEIVAERRGFKNETQAFMRSLFVKKEPNQWEEILGVLPNRHAQSIVQRVCNVLIEWRRSKCSWTEVEKLYLMGLVQTYMGKHKKRRQWLEIALKLERSPRHVGDCYRVLETNGTLARAMETRAWETVMKGDELVCALDDRVPNDVLPARVRHRWSREDKERLKELIYQATGTYTPMNNVPWTALSKHFASRGPTALLELYNMFLAKESPLPRATRQRCIIRYLHAMIEARPDLHWCEIKWKWCLPWWPRSYCQKVAKRIVMRGLGVKGSSYWRFMTSDGYWKKVAECLYITYECARYEYTDYCHLKKHLDALCRKSEGHEEDGWMLPRDTSMAAVRRFIRTSDRGKVEANADAMMQSMWQNMGLDSKPADDATPRTTAPETPHSASFETPETDTSSPAAAKRRTRKRGPSTDESANVDVLNLIYSGGDNDRESTESSGSSAAKRARRRGLAKDEKQPDATPQRKRSGSPSSAESKKSVRTLENSLTVSPMSSSVSSVSPVSTVSPDTQMSVAGLLSTPSSKVTSPEGASTGSVISPAWLSTVTEPTSPTTETVLEVGGSQSSAVPQSVAVSQSPTHSQSSTSPTHSQSPIASQIASGSPTASQTALSSGASSSVESPPAVPQSPETSPYLDPFFFLPESVSV